MNATIIAHLKNRFSEFEVRSVKIKTDKGEIELDKEDYKELIETMNSKRGKVVVGDEGDYEPSELYLFNKDSNGDASKLTFHIIK